MRQTDPVTSVERAYRAAIATEDFAAAAKYRDAGAGLVGWWSGRGDGEDEPGGMYGVMMQITAQHGRYVGTSYSARDLALLQDAARRSAGGRTGAVEERRRTAPKNAADSDSDDAAFSVEAQDQSGHRVFELWIEEGPDGEMRQRAVRLDSVPAGASRDGDGGAGFATTLGGFPLSGPIGAGGVEAGRGVKGFGANANANEKANENANGTEPSRFESWTVVDGKVSAPDAKEGTSPFPFDVDGLSMEELMSYEAQGFMSDVTRMPGFGATWERLKAAYLSEMSSEAADSGGIPDATDSRDDSDVFEAFGGSYRRETDTSAEPHDDFFFEQYVINETEDDAGVVDIDDEFDLEDGAVLELEPMDEYDDEDALDAAAMALLSGQRLDRLPKGLPAAMVREIQRAAEERGMSGFGMSDGDDADDADAWAVEEVRVPVEMELDGYHAFRLASDVDESELASAFGESSLERTLREAAATEAEVEAAVLRGMAEAKARVAEELRAAANAAAVERGETEIVMVNLADEREEGRKGKEKEDGSSTSEDDGSSTSDGDADAKEKDADDAPEVLSSDGVGCRLGGGTPSLFSGAGAAASGEKSKGERLFERLSAAAEESEETGKDQSLDEAIDAFEDADAGAGAGADAGAGSESTPRGFISPASFDRDDGASDSGDFDDDAADALLDLLAQDSDDLPLPLKSRFARIPPAVASRSSSDPFDRLYLGAFGPHGPEVLRLVRGRWGDELGEGDDCVTAVKLTGDANVPAGAASFRAKVGPDARLDSAVSYPEELGVIARYKGQGRVAKPGFTERNWVEGELLLLDGRGGQLTGGAELGFVWAVPGERRLLILFSSLELPEAAPPVGMYVD